MTKTQAGSKGGRATVAKYGSAYMQAIGRKGAQVTRARYRLAPIGTNNFAMIDRKTGEIRATFFDRR